jgi:hypothetical protein
MANRYWVGGTGTWDSTSTTNWSATSGGASGASAPTSADTVTFDANSGTAATVTVASTATASACTINTADINLSLSGSPTITGAVTLTTGTLTLNSSTFTCGSFVSNNSNARTIAFGTGSFAITGNNTTVWACSTITGLSVSGSRTVNLTYSGAVGTRALANGASEAAAFDFNVSAGSDIITFTGGMRNLNFTGFSGTLGANTFSRTIYGDLTFSAGMTLSADTGTTTFAATSGTKTITTNGKTVDAPLTFNGVGGTFAFADALTQGSTKAFTITNGIVRLKDGTTNTVGSFTTGAGTTQRFLQSTVAGSRATITDPSGTNAATYLTIQDIAATGGATWSAPGANNNVDAGNNTGWNFGYTPQTAYKNPMQLRSFTERTSF